MNDALSKYKGPYRADESRHAYPKVVRDGELDEICRCPSHALAQALASRLNRADEMADALAEWSAARTEICFIEPSKVNAASLVRLGNAEDALSKIARAALPPTESET